MHDMLELIAGAKLGAPPPAERSELSVEDVAAPGARSAVARLRHSHHLLARALAEGKSVPEAAALTGYSPSTIYSLRGDPSFQELLAHYTAQVTDLFASVQDRIGALGLSFLDELQHRLETTPEAFSVEQLRKISETLLDRSVAPAKGAAGRGAEGGPSGIAVRIEFTAPAGPQPGSGAGAVLDLQPSGA